MYVLFDDMDLAHTGVLRRFCLCMVALLLQLLMLTVLLLPLPEVVVVAVVPELLVEVTSLFLLLCSPSVWSIDVVLSRCSRCSSVSGGPVGPLCVCGAEHTPLVRLSMLIWLLCASSDAVVFDTSSPLLREHKLWSVLLLSIDLDSTSFLCAWWRCWQSSFLQFPLHFSFFDSSLWRSGRKWHGWVVQMWCWRC